MDNTEVEEIPWLGIIVCIIALGLAGACVHCPELTALLMTGGAQ